MHEQRQERALTKHGRGPVLPSPVNENPRPSSEWAVVAVIVVVGLLALGLLLERARYGIEFTDEGFYLNWIADPWRYRVSATQFGFIYHPLFQWLGQEVVLLRQANMLIISALATALAAVLMHKEWLRPRAATLFQQAQLTGLAFAFSIAGFVSFGDLWLPTPSYNSLALQGLLVAGIGIVLAEASRSRSSLAGWVLLGVGGWLSFMGKPTSAAALLPVVLLYLILARKMRWRGLLVSAACAALLLLISAWSIDGSVAAFARRVMMGAEDAGRMGGGHTVSAIFHWERFPLDGEEMRVFKAIALFAFGATLASLAAQPAIRAAWRLATVGLSLGAGLICLGILPPAGGKIQPLLIAAIPLGTVFGCVIALRRKLLQPTGLRNSALALCIAVFPFVYAFGTNTGYWLSAARASFFWLFAGLVMLGTVYQVTGNWRGVAALVGITQLAVTTLLTVGMDHPYRQPHPLRLNTERVAIASSGASLLVSPVFAEYIRSLQAASTKNGFRPGMPLIDWTGRYPAALFVLGAQPVGLAWMIGGYQGSASLAQAALDRVPCEEIGKAWILTEPMGPRRLPEDLLMQYGLDLRKDFEVVAVLAAPPGNYPEVYEQRLLKPVRSPEIARASCRPSRMTRY